MGKEPHVNSKFEPFIRALGTLSLAWAALEHILNDAIWALLNVDKQHGACVTAQMIGPGPRVRAITSLLKLRGFPDALINEFNSLSSEIESAGRKRNRFMHDQLLFYAATQKMAQIEITADRKPRYIAQEIEPSDIHAVTLECEGLTDKLKQWIQKAISDAPPWTRTQYEQSVDIQQLQLQPKAGSAASKQ